MRYSGKYYEFNQAPDKPLINLSYANGFLPETYRAALEPLCDHYHVLALHERPLWDNCPPESLQRWEQIGDDLLAGLDAISDQPVIAIGHSFGAVAICYAALKRPQRFSRLVLIDPVFLDPHLLLLLALVHRLHLKPRHPLVDGALRRRRDWENTQAAYDYFRSKPLFKRCSDAAVHTYAESITAPGDDGGVHLVWSPEWEAQIYRTLPTDVWSLVWKMSLRVDLPMLVIRGEVTDTFRAAGAGLFSLLNRRAKMVTVPGAGHLVPQEKPEMVGKLIADFLVK